MSDNYYRFFPGDYQRDTGDLSMIEDCAYRRMLDYYYMKESLPSDPERLFRICRAFSTEERTAVKTVVERFFKMNGNRLINRKAEDELVKRRSFIETQREKGRKSAESRAEKKKALEGDLTGVPTPVTTGVQPRYQPEGQPKVNLPSPSPSPSPLPPPKKGKERPPRKKYLDSVLLSDDEYRKLQEAIGQKSLDIGIDQLDYSITVKGGKYRDHYKTLLNWHRRGFLKDNGNGKERSHSGIREWLSRKSQEVDHDEA